MRHNQTLAQARQNSAPRTRSGQGGTALVMSLVILLILTMLGITAMGTSSMEQRMAGNTQEINRAFEAAESGLNQALNAAGTLDLNSAQTTPFTYSDMGASVSVTTSFVQFSPPKRGSGFGNNFDAANFQQDSTGSTAVGAKALLHQGIAQIVPKAN